MFVEFTISPARGWLLKTSTTQADDTLERSGIDGRSGRVNARLEGSWDEVMAVIRGCHEALVDGYPRVVTTIVVVDDHVDEPGSLHLTRELVLSGRHQVGFDTQHERRIPVEFH